MCLERGVLCQSAACVSILRRLNCLEYKKLNDIVQATVYYLQSIIKVPESGICILGDM